MKVLRQNRDSARLARAAAADYGTGAIIAAALVATAAERERRAKPRAGLSGVGADQLAEALPKDLEANLPTIEQIERELGDTGE